jgi:ATP phosphoribosyltransferase regulatory subunit
MGLHGDEALHAKELIGQRNLVALQRLGKPALTRFTLQRGGHEAIASARELCSTESSLAALDALDSLLLRAEALGYGGRVTVDFALLRELDYYTGFGFEGYVEEIGFALCGGGRYDSLLPKFGYDVPAVGWTAGVERLLIALERRGKHVRRRRHRIDVLVAGSDVVAARERAAGQSCARQRRAVGRRRADRRRARARYPAHRHRGRRHGARTARRAARRRAADPAHAFELGRR